MEIQLEHIDKRFGAVHANRDISLTLTGGRIVGVLGENGAGKSTLMKILAGFQPADGGTIRIDGAHVDYRSPLAAIQHGVGMLAQDPLDVGAFTVIENFIYGRPGGLGMRQREALTALKTLATRFGFDLEPEAPIVSLSIGQRQQLEIARLLSLGVKMLILDEPTTGISAEQKDLLFSALKELKASDGLSVLLVSHKLEDVLALCDEVVVLRAGALVGAETMPTTKARLVSLMFGAELAPQTRAPVAIGETVAELNDVMVKNKRVTVENVTMTVRKGEVIGFAGLDGSGQDLIMRALAGLIKPLRGMVTLDGHVMNGKPYREFMRSGVAFSAAGRLEEGLIAGLTTTEHLAISATEGAIVNWSAARETAQAQLKQYDVRGTVQSPVETLSGGNQQRLLMALMPQSPKLMVLEQPTRGLDVDSARWIWTQILQRRESGTAIIFTSADLDELAAYSDRIVVCFTGRWCEVPNTPDMTIDRLGHLIGGDF